MKRLRDSLDMKCLKICVYAGVTVIVTAVALVLLYLTGGFWAKIWKVFIAVLKPLILGGVFYYLLSPLVKWFEKIFTKSGPQKWARPLAVVLAYVLIFIAVILLIILVVLTMYKSLSAISIDGIKVFFLSIADQLSGFMQQIQDKLVELGLSVKKITGLFGSLVNSVTGLFSMLLFAVLFSVYYLLDGQRIVSYFHRVVLVLAGERNYERLNRLMADANKVFSGYLRGQFLDAGIVAVLSSVTLLIAGIPSAVIIGLFMGLGNLIPYFGPVVGYAVTAVVCIPGGNWKELIVAFIIIALIMFVDGNMINPRLLSESVEVHPLLVIAALIGGSVVGGLVGMIVAVPIAALLKMQLDRFIEEREKHKKESGR